MRASSLWPEGPEKKREASKKVEERKRRERCRITRKERELRLKPGEDEATATLVRAWRVEGSLTAGTVAA